MFPTNRQSAAVPGIGTAGGGLGSPQGSTDNGGGTPQISPATPGTFPGVSLPTGSASLRGIGEKFQVNAATGTGSLGIPIDTTPGRGGLGPSLAVNYDSGGGNSCFGVGWNMSTSAITRKTAKGIPRYLDADDSDVFLLNDTEDLVPISDDDKHLTTHSKSGFAIRRYAPRVEASFLRIERWTKIKGGEGRGDVHWRVLTSNNITNIFGRDENSRIADETGQRVFSWLLSEQYDDTGNAVVYRYRAEDSVGVSVDAPNERHPTEQNRSVNRYLKSIQYGNKTPNRDASTWEAFSAFELPADDWLFSVSLEYGGTVDDEHSLPEHDVRQPWACRDWERG